MSNLFGTLSVGLGGLAQASFRTQVASSNLANADSPEYVRQSVIVAPFGANALASQATMRSVGRSSAIAVENYPRFLGLFARQEKSIHARAQTRSDRLEILETAFPGVGETSLSHMVSKFFDSVRSVAADPTDPSARALTVTIGQQLASKVSDRSVLLSKEETFVNQQISSTLEEVNGLIDEVAKLNIEILDIQAAGGDNAMLKAGQRVALDDLADRIDITVLYQDNGSIVVLGAGNNTLVSGSASFTLSSVPTNVSKGSLGGLVAYRDGELAQAITSLNDFADKFIETINTEHQAGFDLNGAVGEVFFDAPVGGNEAFNMQVNASLIADPNLVAASGNAALILDNTNAQALADLEFDNDFGASGKTPGELAYTVAQQVGFSTSTAKAEASAAQASAASVDAQLRSSAGVDPDAEMTRLMEAQHAYQAAAKIISTAMNMMEILLSIGR